MTAAREGFSPVTEYKTFLRSCIDRRPSGLRQRLATALGKHKSFISQITSPGYSVPIPPGDLPVLFEVCHLTESERRRFLELYEIAHPGRAVTARRHAATRRTVTVAIPEFRSPALAREVEAAILEAAALIVRTAKAAETSTEGAAGSHGGEGDEEVHKRP